jgi:hypothetical protein
MDRASGPIELANGRYGEVRMTTPVPFTQKPTVVIRAKARESKRIYRDIELICDSTLEDLAFAIVEAFGWDCDHCYGFYSHLGQSLHDSEESYELFADLAEEDGSAIEVRDGVLGVKDTAICDVFENRGKKMQFLFDYGDDHRFELEARGFGETMPGIVYPRLMSAKGELGPQYPDYDDDVLK